MYIYLYAYIHIVFKLPKKVTIGAISGRVGNRLFGPRFGGAGGRTLLYYHVTTLQYSMKYEYCSMIYYSRV